MTHNEEEELVAHFEDTWAVFIDSNNTASDKKNKQKGSQNSKVPSLASVIGTTNHANAGFITTLPSFMHLWMSALPVDSLPQEHSIRIWKQFQPTYETLRSASICVACAIADVVDENDESSKKERSTTWTDITLGILGAAEFGIYSPHIVGFAFSRSEPTENVPVPHYVVQVYLIAPRRPVSPAFEMDEIGARVGEILADIIQPRTTITIPSSVELASQPFAGDHVLFSSLAAEEDEDDVDEGRESSNRNSLGGRSGGNSFQTQSLQQRGNRKARRENLSFDRDSLATDSSFGASWSSQPTSTTKSQNAQRGGNGRGGNNSSFNNKSSGGGGSFSTTGGGSVGDRFASLRDAPPATAPGNRNGNGGGKGSPKNATQQQQSKQQQQKGKQQPSGKKGKQATPQQQQQQQPRSQQQQHHQQQQQSATSSVASIVVTAPPDDGIMHHAPSSSFSPFPSEARKMVEVAHDFDSLIATLLVAEHRFERAVGKAVDSHQDFVAEVLLRDAELESFRRETTASAKATRSANDTLKLPSSSATPPPAEDGAPPSTWRAIFPQHDALLELWELGGQKLRDDAIAVVSNASTTRQEIISRTDALILKVKELERVLEVTKKLQHLADSDGSSSPPPSETKKESSGKSLAAKGMPPMASSDTVNLLDVPSSEAASSEITPRRSGSSILVDDDHVATSSNAASEEPSPAQQSREGSPPSRNTFVAAEPCPTRGSANGKEEAKEENDTAAPSQQPQPKKATGKKQKQTAAEPEQKKKPKCEEEPKSVKPVMKAETNEEEPSKAKPTKPQGPTTTTKETNDNKTNAQSNQAPPPPQSKQQKAAAKRAQQESLEAAISTAAASPSIAMAAASSKLSSTSPTGMTTTESSTSASSSIVGGAKAKKKEHQAPQQHAGKSAVNSKQNGFSGGQGSEEVSLPWIVYGIVGVSIMLATACIYYMWENEDF